MCSPVAFPSSQTDFPFSVVSKLDAAASLVFHFSSSSLVQILSMLHRPYFSTVLSPLLILTFGQTSSAFSTILSSLLVSSTCTLLLTPSHCRQKVLKCHLLFTSSSPSPSYTGILFSSLFLCSSYLQLNVHILYTVFHIMSQASSILHCPLEI